MPPKWAGLGRMTKLSPVRNHKGQSILEFIQRHNPCSKELVYFANRLAVHMKNKVIQNTKISRDTISLITPKGVHNYTVALTTKRSYFNNYITHPSQKRLEKERGESGRKRRRSLIEDMKKRKSPGHGLTL